MFTICAQAKWIRTTNGNKYKCIQNKYVFLSFFIRKLSVLWCVYEFEWSIWLYFIHDVRNLIEKTLLKLLWKNGNLKEKKCSEATAETCFKRKRIQLKCKLCSKHSISQNEIHPKRLRLCEAMLQWIAAFITYTPLSECNTKRFVWAIQLGWRETATLSNDILTIYTGRAHANG